MAPKALKATLYILFLAVVTLGYANSARILDEALLGANPLPTTVPASNPINPTTLLPSGQIQAAIPTNPTVNDIENNDVEAPIPETDAPIDDDVTPPVDVAAPVVAPVTPAVPEVDSPLPETEVPVTTVPPPTAGPTIPSPIAPIPATPVASPATIAPAAPLPVATPVAGPAAHLSFFMHDILGGSAPSVRVVTGLVASTVANVPFSKPNNNIFPLNGGTPLNNNNLNGFLNNNRNSLPSIAGLTGTTGLTNTQTSTVIQNSGNNNIVNGGGNQPFVTAGQLPTGATLQKLMFGSVTVIDDELTEGQELGSAVLGRAQGFYLASSLDGNSHTMAFTVLMHGEHDVEDTISLFGVHRTASPVSHIAVIGGTGKYENANGYAAIESLHQEDQHTTDGVDTIMQISVYLSE